MFSLLHGHGCLVMAYVAWLALGFVLELPSVAGYDAGRQETSSKVSF